jgi:hydroxymethylbilane synthase
MLRIGSRGSALAMTQTQWVRSRILQHFPEVEIEIKIIRTSADRDQISSLRKSPSTGVFVKEIEEALLGGDIDLAVHSLKDVPTTIPDDLLIAAVPEREDPRDALLSSNPAASLSDLPANCLVGTGSIRRQAQLLAVRPDLQVLDIRGNVDSRIRKMEEGQYDAIILACAGLSRLGLRDRISFPIELAHMLPAPGQGALAIEIRGQDRATSKMVAPLHHRATAVAVEAERAFLRLLGGGCNSPIATYGSVDESTLTLRGLLASPDGAQRFRDCVTGPADNPEQAATALVEKLLASGAEKLLLGSC